MIHIDNQSDIILSTDLLEKIALDISDKDIELIITDAKNIQEINRQSRGKNATTDVLSFPLEAMPHVPLGSIVINAELVQEKAKEFQHSPQDELTLLFLHGLLHLVGFDHEVDDGIMRDKEKKLIEKFDLPKSLILRSGDSK